MNFDEKVWQQCKRIPSGKVSTYGEIAKALGIKGYQAVGMALNRNPHSIYECSGDDLVPCHRVVNSDGKLGGFAKGSVEKKRLLAAEGVEVRDGKVDLEKHFFKLV